MYRKTLPFFLTMLLVLLSVVPTAAQDGDPELTLSLRKNFGYALGNTLQGTFTLTAHGPDDLVQVTFRVGDQVLVTDNEAPFTAKFSTGDFPPGRYSLAANGITSQGLELRTQPRQARFISADAAMDEISRVLVPLVVGLMVLILLGTVVPILIQRRRPPKLGVYGFAGGAVCRRCGLPFPRHFMAINLPGGKLERCPHCEKWSIASRATASQLQAAEARMQQAAHDTLPTQDPEAHLQRLIDESRFERDDST